jgi:hypothetical protein
VRAIERLGEHCTPPGFPRYGYLLEYNGTPVGVILLIFTVMFDRAEPRVRCSVSSWYTAPAFRSHATLLTSHALRHKQVTYLNISPHPRTLPILEAQGYVRYCDGHFIAAPAISPGSGGRAVEVLALEGISGDLPAWEFELLSKHAHYGCISVICRSADQNFPFVFLPRRKICMVPWAYLAYCRQVDDFVGFAHYLGKFLARRGIFLVEIDANGPIKNIVGRYLGGAPKYYKGPDRPRLGDIAYSERPMLGF